MKPLRILVGLMGVGWMVWTSAQAQTDEYVIAWGISWGWSSAIQVPGDYDGDGATDLAVYDSLSGEWYILSAQNEVITWKNQWGGAGSKPIPGDFDGDGRSDLAVVDPQSGKWYIKSLAHSEPGPAQTLILSPTNQTASFIGQQMVFSARNGTPPYSWSVSRPAVGSISPTNGRQVLYSATDPRSDNNVVVQDASGQIALAIISARTNIFTVSPTNATLGGNGDLLLLTTSGGVPPFTWRVSDAALGQMINPPADSHMEVYQRLYPADNSILIEDSVGNTCIAVIHQP